MNLYPLQWLCILITVLVYGQTARAQITITSITATSVCAGSPIYVAYNNSYSGQATLSLYLYGANDTDSLYLTQINTSGGNGALSTYLPISLSTKTYTVGIKLTASQLTYLSPRSNDFTINAIPSSPTVGVSSVGYCQYNSATPLSATASSGGTLRWYMTHTGGSFSTEPPSPSTATAGLVIYYVSQSVNGCEGSRASISVAVKSLPPFPTASSISYCQDVTPIPLSATPSPGGSLTWYTSPVGGTGSIVAFIPSTSTVGSFTYYVSQSINDCEGSRASVNVLVRPNPAVSVNPSSATLTPAQTSLTLTATASVSTLLWSTNETTASILVNTPGVYSVRATSREGCATTVSSIISQTPISEVYSIKTGSWDDSTVWSTNQIPTRADAVRLRHSVSLPSGYQAQAGLVGYDAGGDLQMGTDSSLKLRY